MLDLIIWGVGVAIAAFTYCSILVQPGMILNGWYNWLDKLIGPGSGDMLNDGPGRAEWLFKPLVGCCKCVAGQFGLWSYLILFPSYNLAHHILFVTLVIYLIKFVEQAYRWNR
jgi:hypothetical protein